MAAILNEWFNGTLAAWTISGADIVTVNNDEKLRLNASGEYARRDFSAPATGKLIVESDLWYNASGTQGYLEVIDSGGPTALATVRFTGGNAYVSTDTVGETSHAFTVAEYRQVVLAFDQDAATVRFFISQADSTYGTLDLIAEKAYSGGTIDRVSLRTSTSGTVYADMVKVFVPGTFITGDSIADGKPNWSEHPHYSGRLGSTEDETNNPSYQLGLLTGEHVAGRGFGGSSSAGVLAAIQTVTLDQYATGVIVNVGHNDLYDVGGSLATLKTNIASIYTTLVAGGIDPDAITFCKVAPSGYFDGTPSDDEDNRLEYNRWLTDFCAHNGCRIAFASEALNDNTKTTPYKRLNPAYNAGDGTHLGTAGDVVLAREMFRARVPGGVLRRAGAGLGPASFLTDSPGIAHVKGLSYTVATSPRPELDARYTVTTTHAAVTRAATYRVAIAHPRGLGAQYIVGTGTVQQKAARYAVRDQVGLGKSATYSLAGRGGSPVTLQRSCSYVVEVTTQTYYAAPAASGGSDANPGTLGSPFLTIAHGLSVLSAGKELVLRAGTYHEHGLNFPASGTYAGNQLKRIKVRGYPGEAVTIDGDYTGTGSSEQVFLTDSGRSYLSVEDLEIVNSYYQAWYTGNSSPCSYLLARNLHIHDIYGWTGDNAATIRWDNCTDGLIENCELHAVWNQHLPSHPLSGYGNTIMTFGAVRLRVRNCEVYNGDNLVFQKNPDASGGDGMIVEHCTLHDGNVGIRYGLQGTGSPPHHNQVAHHNVIYNIANDGIKAEVNYASAISDGLQVYNNTILCRYGFTLDGFINQQVYNNIIKISSGFRLEERDGFFAQTNEITYWDYNLWDSTGTNGSWTLQKNLGSVYTTSSFTAWKALTTAQPDLSINNPDANGLLADPLFTNAAAFDFTLQPTSPAIGAGRFGGDIGALAFEGGAGATINAQAAYRVRSTQAATATGATYRVATTPAAAALGLSYVAVPPPGLLARAASYAVRATAPGISAALAYAVRTPGTPAARALAYEIDTSIPTALARGLAYRVTAAPVVARGLAYALGAGATGARRTVAVPPEAHGAAVPPETHSLQVME